MDSAYHDYSYIAAVNMATYGVELSVHEIVGGGYPLNAQLVKRGERLGFMV
jgi:hypothetical protein